MKNLLFCKNCENLKSDTIDKECKFCKINRRFVAEDKGNKWYQYTTICPLKKYSGKAELGDNPTIFTFGEK